MIDILKIKLIDGMLNRKVEKKIHYYNYIKR